MNHYENPYSGETFFRFFLQLAYRLAAFVKGEISFETIASDEIQMLVLTGVAVSAGLLGSFLVLRRMAMLANALSHTILLGIVLAFIITLGGVASMAEGHQEPFNLTAMMWASLVMGILTTFLTEFLHKTVGLQEDASIGLVFSSLFAVGIILLTIFTRNAHIGTEIVMGNVDALRVEDCRLVYLVMGINAACIILLFKEFKITTFDQGLSRALGFSPGFFNYLLMTLVSATAIAAFRAVGVFMVLAFFTGPALTARLLTNNLRTMVWLSIAIGTAASIAGVALSRHLLTVYGLALSTGGLVVCIIVLLFAAAIPFRKRD